MKKKLMEGLPKNLLDLEDSLPICLLTKSTNITRVPTIYVSKFVPGLMIQMDFSFSMLK